MACVDGNCPAERNPSADACLCPPCPNHRLCGMYYIPQVYLDIHRGTCGNCAASFGKALSFVEEEFECSVCREGHPVGIRHPSNCIHVFCIDCTRHLFWGDETEVDPRDYGFTGDGDSSLEEWTETEDAEEYNLAVDAQDEEHDLLEKDGRCPLCRHKAIPDWQAKVGEWAPA